MISRVIILVLVVVTISCDNVNRGPERVAVARAGDRVLYLDQIPATLIAPSMSKTDSISVVQSYIRRWARKELVALKAEENLTSGYKAEVNRQLDEMRNNLLIYQYEQQMIIQKMDTTVTDSELQNYYISNLSTFNLSSNIVKALFIKLPDGTPGIDRVRGLYRSTDPDDMKTLEDYCYQYALRYDDFNDEWIPFTQLLMEVPFESDNHEEWLSRNSSVELKDGKYVYFIVIREYKLKNSVAPFEYISGQVKTIILNNRRNDFLQKLEDGIYNEAVRENALKVY
jgi:hypothetical protein